MTDGVRVNLAARNDVIGDVLRQKQTLERVSEVLCDGLGDEPAVVWRGFALLAHHGGHEPLADRCRGIADLIESERL